jgi:hypothetical protein
MSISDNPLLAFDNFLSRTNASMKSFRVEEVAMPAKAGTKSKKGIAQWSIDLNPTL